MAQQDTIDSIVTRFGRERTERLLREHNVTGTLEALTESEGRAITRFKSFDAFRTRFSEEGRAFFARINQEALPADQVRVTPAVFDSTSCPLWPCDLGLRQELPSQPMLALCPIRNRQAQLKCLLIRPPQTPHADAERHCRALAPWTSHGRLGVADFEADSGHESHGGEGMKDYGQGHGQRP